MRTREAKFVEEFFARFMVALPDLQTLNLRMRKEKEAFGNIVRELGAEALKPAGYAKKRDIRRKNRQRAINVRAERTVDYLLNMPRVQKALDEKFCAAGFTMERATEILAEIAEGTKRTSRQVLNADGAVVELETDVLPSDRMRAVEMRIRMTTGFAPTKAVNVHGKVQPDAFFNADEFAQTPPIALSEQEPKNVTPQADRKKK